MRGNLAKRYGRRARAVGVGAALSMFAPALTGAQRPPPPPPPPRVTVPPLDTARREPFAVPARRAVTGFGTIDGIVTDTGLVPIASANITILSSSVRVDAGENGRFRILHVPAGQYLLIVRRLGYRPASGAVQVAADDTLRLAYALEPAPQTLGAVVVREERQSFGMMEFEYRRKLGLGEFMTQEQIERHNMVYATDLLRMFFHSVGVSDSNKGFDQFAYSRRGLSSVSGQPCATVVLVDRVPMPTPFNLLLLPSPRDLAGIEAFAGPATTPVEYAMFDRGCGLILVWTKQGY